MRVVYRAAPAEPDWPHIPHIIFQLLRGPLNDWHSRASWLVHR